MRLLLLLFAELLFLINTSNCQEIIVYGKILSESGQKPIGNATVISGKYGCKSNPGGDFALKADVKTLMENGIVITCIGFSKKQIAITNVHSLIRVELKDSAQQLNEFVISTRGRNIVEKAYSRIKNNYPQQPFWLTGILRIYFLQNNGYYYKNDAVTKNYFPSYKKNAIDGETILVQNKTEVKRGADLDTTPDLRYVNFYRTILTSDFVHRRAEYIVPGSMKNFTYSLKDTELYEGAWAYKIEFFSNRNKEIEGTLYIDTLTYAFAGNEVTRNKVRKLGFRSQKKSVRKMSYQQINHKWYPKASHSETEYEKADDDIHANAIADFVSVSIDTADIKSPQYDNVVQSMDVTQQLNKYAGGDQWKQYDSLFEKAEKDNYLSAIQPPPKDTLDEQATVFSQQNNWLSKILTYLRNDNYRLSLSVSKLPLSSVTYQFKNFPASVYSFDVGSYFRIVRNLFFKADASFNAGVGGIKNKVIGYYLANVFGLNTKGRMLNIEVTGGYNKITLTQKDLTKKYIINNWAAGLALQGEISHRIYYFIAGAFNKSFRENVSDLMVKTQPITLGSGVIIKL